MILIQVTCPNGLWAHPGGGHADLQGRSATSQPLHPFALKS